jgi:hypothetical protein
MKHAAPGLKFAMWREEDFVWQRGNDFWVIPRSFLGEKRPVLLHYGREN